MFTDFEVEYLHRPSAPRRTEWIIDGVIPAGGLTVLYGPPGSFKSFLALDMALAAATERDWHSRTIANYSLEDNELIRMAWPSVYMGTEAPDDIKYQRVPAWLYQHGVSQNELTLFQLIREPVNLRHPGSVEELTDTLNRMSSPPDLLVLDSYLRC